MRLGPPRSSRTVSLIPYTPLYRSPAVVIGIFDTELHRLPRGPFDALLIIEIGIFLFVIALHRRQAREVDEHAGGRGRVGAGEGNLRRAADRKSTRLNSSH